MNIDDKATAIEKGVIAAAYEFNRRPDLAHLTAVGQLATACALLTSSLKAERERGKTMVRTWRTTEVSHAKPVGVE